MVVLDKPSNGNLSLNLRKEGRVDITTQDAWWAGHDAGVDNKSQDSCTYTDSALRESWRDGWNRARSLVGTSC